MYYTLKEICKMSGMTEHTIRYYTDKGLLPCRRDGANRRIFDDDSLNWLTAIRCLKGCGMSIESIRHYCDLCRLPASRETLEARFQIILGQREQAYRRIEEAKATAAYMDEKVEHYQQILAGLIPDDSNPETWTEETRPERHEEFRQGPPCGIRGGRCRIIPCSG